MKKSELIYQISKKNKTLNYTEASMVFNSFINSLLDLLLESGKVELRGFGSFSVKEYVVNKKKNESRKFVLKKDRYKRIYFRQGKKLFDKLNMK